MIHNTLISLKLHKTKKYGLFIYLLLRFLGYQCGLYDFLQSFEQLSAQAIAFLVSAYKRNRVRNSSATLFYIGKIFGTCTKMNINRYISRIPYKNHIKSIIFDNPSSIQYIILIPCSGKNFSICMDIDSFVLCCGTTYDTCLGFDRTCLTWFSFSKIR